MTRQSNPAFGGTSLGVAGVDVFNSDILTPEEEKSSGLIGAVG